MRSRPYAVLILAPVVSYFTAQLLVALFVVKPPPLGWIGFGVAAAIGLLIGALAIGLLPHARLNGSRLHPRAGGPRRLLVVVDERCGSDALAELLRSKLGGRAESEVHVVAPVLPTPLHFLLDDEERERADAGARLAEVLQTVSQLGVDARGVVGDDDPLQAIGDALAGFPADEVVLMAPAGTHRRWLEKGIERRARDVYGVHVSTLTVETPSAASR